MQQNLTTGQQRILDAEFFDFNEAEWWRKELAFQLKGYSVKLASRNEVGLTIYSLIVEASPEGNAH